MSRRKHPTNRIFKRKDSPFWQAKFVSGGKTYVRTTRCRNEAAAESFLTIAKTQYRNGPPVLRTCRADGSHDRPTPERQEG